MGDKVTEAIRGVRKRLAKRRTKKKAKRNERQRKKEKLKRKTEPAREEARKLKSDVAQATPSVPSFSGGGSGSDTSVSEELGSLDEDMGVASSEIGGDPDPNGVLDNFDDTSGDFVMGDVEVADGDDDFADPLSSDTDDLTNLFDGK